MLFLVSIFIVCAGLLLTALLIVPKSRACLFAILYMIHTQLTSNYYPQLFPLPFIICIVLLSSQAFFLSVLYVHASPPSPSRI